MYRLGSNLAHVHHHVADIKMNDKIEIPASDIVDMDVQKFRMNLSKVAKDIGRVFVTRFDSHARILTVMRIS